jgi:S-adenosylmethionine hydrolase
VARASFVLVLTLDYLPADAVVVVVVDPGVGGKRRGIILSVGERILVGPDNGFASDLLARGAPLDARAIDEEAAARAVGVRARGATFHGRDLFGPVAAAIARGVGVPEFGPRAGGIVMLEGVPSVSFDGERVRGTGRHVDRFGNVLTDIPVAAVRRVCPDAGRARVSIRGRDVGPLRRTYGDGRPGELIAIVNSWECVEAAANGARAIDLLGGPAPEAVPFDIGAG